MNMNAIDPRANTEKRDPYLNVIQHQEEHILKQAVGHEHHHYDHDKHHVYTFLSQTLSHT